jgi:WD40 repeat protein
MRDDFPKNVVDALGKRAGFLCSNPVCRRSTIGPQKGGAGAVNLGVAAHITAASPGGPRYDASLSTEERSSSTNGLWACQGCAKHIDSHDPRHTVAVLKEWKEQVEHEALQRLNATSIVKRKVAVLKRKLVGHKNYVWDVLITPDGRRVLSASNDKTVRMWDVATGNRLAIFEGHAAFVCSLALSPEGKYLAAGAADGTVRLWDLASGDSLAMFHHGAADAKVTWGTTPSRLISGGADGGLRVWSLPDATHSLSIAAHSKPILKIAVVGDDIVVSVSADRTARACRISSGKCLSVFEGHTGEINSVAVMPAKRQIVSASEDCTLRIWDIDTGACIQTLRGHCQTVWRVAASPDGRLLASGAADNTVRIWDLELGECVQELRHPDCVAAVAFGPDGSNLAVGCDDTCVYMYSVGKDFSDNAG